MIVALGFKPSAGESNQHSERGEIPHPFGFAQGRLCRKERVKGWGILDIEMTSTEDYFDNLPEFFICSR